MAKLLTLITIGVMCLSPSFAQKEDFIACLQESGLSDISEVKNLNTKDLSCFIKCTMTKTGEIDSEGNVNMDKINLNLDKMKLTETIKDSLKTCFAGIEKIEKCEDAQKVTKCWSGVFNDTKWFDEQ
uniref:Odorant-binding protein n=1 Tax=Galeruca daurica TaxID=1651263 RepID=A0A1U9W4Z4_9CUCU|nr:odorant-binding protein [Galeruca daurica]